MLPDNDSRRVTAFFLRSTAQTHVASAGRRPVRCPTATLAFAPECDDAEYGVKGARSTRVRDLTRQETRETVNRLSTEWQVLADPLRGCDTKARHYPPPYDDEFAAIIRATSRMDEVAAAGIRRVIR